MVVVGRVAIRYFCHTDGLARLASGRLVDARAVDVFAQEVVIAVIFGDHVGAVGFDGLTTGMDVTGNK